MRDEMFQDILKAEIYRPECIPRFAMLAIWIGVVAPMLVENDTESLNMLHNNPSAYDPARGIVRASDASIHGRTFLSFRPTNTFFFMIHGSP